MLDPEAFLDLANQVAKLKMYPYFELAHAIVCCISVKEDMSSGIVSLHTYFWYFISSFGIFKNF